jgi:hypothetical protein
MQTPYIDAIADLPILTPPDEKPGKDAEEEPLLALVKYTPDDVSELLVAATEIERLNLPPVIIPEQEEQRLADFFAILLKIYAGSFGQDGATEKYGLLPSVSIARLGAFLRLPKNRALLSRMRRGFKEVRKRQSGVTLYQDAISKFVWDTFLIWFDFGRGGPLTIYIIVPEVGGLNTDIGVKVHWNQAGINAKAIVSDDGIKALEWVLSAFLLYPDELGLISNGE